MTETTAGSPSRADVAALRRLHPRAFLLAWNRELTVYSVIAICTLATRLTKLADRPLHHDESSHAWFSWLLATKSDYEYDPIFHGPLQFYSGVVGYALAGVGDLGIRLMPALLGAACTVLPYFIRRQLGTAGALAASVLLAISPSYVYFSRFAREDIYAAFLTLVLIVLVFRFLDSPRRWHPAAILGFLAASFATKETTFITVFVAGTFFVTVAVVELVRARSGGISTSRTPLLAALRAPGLAAWVWGLCAFALTFTVLFTTFFANPQGLRDGIYKSISYWLSQHEVERGDQPHFFYLVLLAGYELPIVLLGAWGVVTVLRRRTLHGVLLAWMFVLSTIIYSWAGERMPWLVLHPLLPLILLAGIGAQDLWSRRKRWIRVATAVAAVAGAAILVHGAIAVAYRHPADPAEFLVFTQTSVQLEPVRDRIFELDRALVNAEGRHPVLHVDSWGGTAWPWGWYLRDLPVFYADMSDPAYAPDADVIVVAELNQPRLAPLLRNYERRRFLLREWWVVDYDAASPRAVLDWLIHRRAWSVEGTMGEWFYVRKDLVRSRIGGRELPGRPPRPSTELRRRDGAPGSGRTG
jgi:uncharacterized protein (TIGR03663 family)